MCTHRTAFRCFSVLLAWLASAPAFGQPQVQQLADQLQHGDVAIRRQAAIALGRVSFAPSANVLGRALRQDPDVRIRLEVVRALRNIVFRRFPGYPEALRMLGQACDDSLQKDELVRLRASEALWEAASKDLLDPVPYLERNLTDSSPRLRLSAVQMLRKLGTPATLTPLGRAALDKTQTQTIRLRAIAALGAVSLTDAGPVGRGVGAANVHATDILRLPRLTPKSALQPWHRRQIAFLAAVVDDPGNNRALRLQALKSMGQVKDKSAIPALRSIARNETDPAIRELATRILSHILARQYE